MKDHFISLAENIKQNSKNKTIIYIPNPGNFGDGLIRFATKKFFFDFGIEHIELNVNYDKIKSQLLPFLLKANKYYFVFGGGGGWCNAYSCGYDICKTILLATKNLLVLPSTYELTLPANKGIFYRRDNFNSKDNAPHALFCDDMAFYLTMCESMSIYKEKLKIKPLGVFMRTDKEAKASDVNLPSFNRDISKLGDHMSNGDEFLLMVSDFKEIHTDRLHVCIAGIVANVKVNLYLGNYFKIRAIYKSSIFEKFENVALHDQSIDFSALSKHFKV